DDPRDDLVALTGSGVLILDSPATAQDEDDGEDFAELIPLTRLPVQLPPKGTSPPARDAASLAELLRTAQAGQQVLAATAGWLLSERRSSPRTQQAYIKEASWWLWWMQARGLDLTAVPYLEADLFAAAMRHAGYEPGTRRRRLSALSSWYRYLIRAEAATVNPFDGMELPKRRSKATRHLTEAQLDDLVAYAVEHESARTAAVVALLKGTACRISELTGVQVDALGHAGAQRILTLPAKGDRDHRVVIAATTGQLLDAYLAERGTAPGPLFVTRTGLPLQRSYVLALVQRLAEKVGIPDPRTLSLHSIRHSVATALLQAGEPLDVVQALLGHADPRTTQAYLHVDQLERSPAHRADHRLAIALGRAPR
ncbi:hypothetical protein FE391_45870, partial [Nonomuraea sp. KC401]|uniref:tyrosine-type recombinase/integrase n=2 Tax=unclassified Nonomuraea TaxID=2593643 RepID=UPI0010FD4701